MALNKNKTAMSLGILLAVIHAVWAILIAVIPAQLQIFLDWIFNLHMLEPIWVITSFNLVNSIMLVIVTFISGYICGGIFAYVWNWLNRR